MRLARIIAIAVAALIAVLLVGANTAYATFPAHATGYGPTLAAAEQNAKSTLLSEYTSCTDFVYYSYGELNSSEWYADVTADCPYPAG